MNTIRSSQFLKNLKPKKAFEIPNPQQPDVQAPIEAVSGIVAGTSPDHPNRVAPDAEVPPDYLKALISIATNAWRAKSKMVDAGTGEIREDMKRVGRHVEAICRNLAEAGIVIRDHTGEAYDEGQPMKVIASKPKAGLDKERVSETLLPSIFWKNHLVQNGEIVTEAPAAPDPTTKSQSPPS